MRTRGPRMLVDVKALRRAMGDRTMDEIETSADMSSGNLRQIIKRGGGIQGDTLDRLCGALGIHESEVVA